MGDLSSDENKARTISKAVRFRFEQFASRICDEAKVEFTDRPFKIQEWMLRLEHKFREIDALGKTTDEVTAEMVLAIFGPAENTIKTLRGGWKGFWHRLIYYERYTNHRLVALASLCLLHDWIRTSSSIKYSLVRITSLQVTFIAPKFDYYLGILFMAVVAIPRCIRPRDPRLKRIVQIVATLTVSWFYYIVLTQCLSSVRDLYGDFSTGNWHQPDDDVPIWKDAATIVIWIGALLFEIGFLVAAVPLVISEIFALPRRRREIREELLRKMGVR